jgi:hypothetical protein
MIRTDVRIKNTKEFICPVQYSVQVVKFFLDFPRIRRGNQTFMKMSPLFRPFLFKIGQKFAADLAGRCTFYSAPFQLCGRKIGQLATLGKIFLFFQLRRLHPLHQGAL